MSKLEFLKRAREQRQSDRFGVAGTISVYDCNRQQAVGQLVNISLDGLMLVGDSLLQDEHVYQLELWLPQPLCGSDRLRLGVDCLWNLTDEDEPLCWAGCQIIDLSDLAREQIIALIALMGDRAATG